MLVYFVSNSNFVYVSESMVEDNGVWELFSAKCKVSKFQLWSAYEQQSWPMRWKKHSGCWSC